MNLDEFNDNYLNIILQEISKGKRNVFLLGDFNVDLIKYDKQTGTNEFIDSLSAFMYTKLSAGNGRFRQQNVIQDRKSFITQSKLMIF